MERALAITNGEIKYDPAFSPTPLPGLAVPSRYVTGGLRHRLISDQPFGSARLRF
jgi:Iap family predicted aminopeptidase